MVEIGITDVFPEHWHPMVEAAAPDGWTFHLARDSSEEARFEVVRNANAVFSGSLTPTDEMLRAARRLRFVQKVGAGYDNINVELCKELGIAVARLPGNNAVTVAEHTVMLMLAVYRRLPASDRLVRAGVWGKGYAREFYRELRAKTIGLVGLGRIGKEVARRLRGFETTLVYHDMVRTDPDVESDIGVEAVSLDELLGRSDIVSLHLPLFPETKGMIDRDRLAAMKPGSVLINCARGELVDEPALVEALTTGHLAGAGLDCVAEERPGGAKAFWDMDNVVLTSHVAGVSIENFATMMQRAFENARRYLAGQPLPAEDVVWVPEGRS